MSLRMHLLASSDELEIQCRHPRTLAGTLVSVSCVQATFLQPPDQQVVENAALRAELDALGPDELETKCRRSGVSRAGDR